NTFLVPAVDGGNTNYAVIVDTSNLSGTATVNNNYYDLTAAQAGNFLFAGHYNGTGAGTGIYNGTVTTFNNANMVTGAYNTQNVTSVRQVVSSPSTGTEFPGDKITLTLDFSAAVTVTGTPTLALNDGGNATYVGGSGTNALTFTYTVGAGDTPVSSLAVTQVNL